jgi:hypothetical protein
LRSLGLTYTQVAGARSRRDFLEGLRQSHGAVAGRSGNYWKMTGTVWTIGWGLIGAQPLAWLLFPLMAAVPLVTLANVLYETAFAAKWRRRLEGLSTVSIRPIQPEAIP